MLKVIAAAAAALTLFVQPSLAQTASVDAKPSAAQAPVDPARLAAARRFMTAAHVNEAMSQVVATLLPEIMRSAAQSEHLSQEQLNLVTGVILDQLRADTPDLVELMAHAYANRLSEADLNAAADFYESEAGRHFIAEQGQLIQDGQAAGHAWSERAMPTVLGRIRALMQTPSFEHP